MAKYRKYKLSWKPSPSNAVVGYKLYWSKEERLSYDSNSIELGNVSDVNIPDIFKYRPPEGVTIRFGISAVDSDGNESDLTLLSKTYQTAALVAPSDLSIDTLDDYTILDSKDEASKSPEDEQLEALAEMEERLTRPNDPPPKIKYYDDVGYRKLEFDE